jgi:AraC family transcriptional regulator, transcriptional activator of pobA
MKDNVMDISTITMQDMLAGHKSFVIKGLCELGKEFFEHNAEPHRHDFYSIYWIREGKMIHTIDTTVHEGIKNTLFFLAPGQVHKMEFSNRVEGIMIAFPDTFLCMKDEEDAVGLDPDLFLNSHFFSVLHVDDEIAGELEWVTRLMKKEATRREDNYESAFKTLLRYFLILASRSVLANEKGITVSSVQDHHAGLFRQFRVLIEQHYAALKNVSDYARLLHVKAVMLNEISKQISGLTAGEHIRNRIIIEAKRYLFMTDFTSKEIAYKLGFDDPHYFSRFFKKYTGQSPQEFKFMSRHESTVVK